MITHFIFFSLVLIMISARKSEKLALNLSFLTIFVYAAIRTDFGNDYWNYSNIHEMIQNDFTQLPYTGCEAYTLINRIVPDFNLLIAIMSFVYCFGVYLLIRNNVAKKYYFISVFIFLINPYLFLMNLSAMRQTMAVVMFMIAVHYGYKKNPIMYVFFVWLASMFHSTAVILYPLYFVVSRELKYSYKFVSVVLVATLFMNIPAVNQFIADQTQELLGNNGVAYLGGLRNSLRATLLSSVYFMFVYVYLNKIDGMEACYARLYMVGLMCSMWAYNIAMFTRIQMYFDIFSVVSIPAIFKMIVNSDKSQTKKFLICGLWGGALTMIYLARYYSFFNNPMWTSFTEYQTIFSK